MSWLRQYFLLVGTPFAHSVSDMREASPIQGLNSGDLMKQNDLMDSGELLD
jgi:hypothetical protein